MLAGNQDLIWHLLRPKRGARCSEGLGQTLGKMGSDPWVPGLCTTAPWPPNTHSQFPLNLLNPNLRAGGAGLAIFYQFPSRFGFTAKFGELTLTFYIKMEELSSGSRSELGVALGSGHSSL